MKNVIYTLGLIFLSVSSMSAQKIAVVDINAILESMPEYKEAGEALDLVAATWRQDIAKEYDEIKSMYNKFQAEQILLSEEQRTARENEIIQKEKEVRELQKKRFGPEGDLFKKRQELVSPVQDRVYFAIEDFAADRGFDLVLDKSGNTGILFTSEEYDHTESVKKRL